MTLELQDWNVLDELKSDEELAFLLNDALETRDADYVDHIVATLERAKALTGDVPLTSTQRLIRAAGAVGLQLAGVPRAA